MLIYLLVYLFITMIYLSEIGGYFWHRFFAHNDVIPFVKKTHDIHHEIIDDKADGDFIYIIILLILYLIFLIYFISNIYILLVLYFSVFISFIWSYYIHSAYHTENHWLNNYEWFKNDKKLHMQHHIDPNTNYGIATHFTDVILDTFDYSYSIHKIS